MYVKYIVYMYMKNIKAIILYIQLFRGNDALASVECGDMKWTCMSATSKKFDEHFEGLGA